MKIFEILFLKTYNSLITVLLALIGFGASCIKMEYGSPHACFKVKGKVESMQDSTVIKNIQVSMEGATVRTDADGNYQIPEKDDYPTDQTYHIQFKDIDSTLNGEFADLDTIVEFKNPKFTNGDGDWYQGRTEKEFNVKLNPKK
jgi:putative lipoprotein (rSAM/lipoprotein system)